MSNRKKDSDKGRSRAWTGTWNNYTAVDYDAVLNHECTFVIVGKEVGESGTPHLQFYIRFENAVRMNTLKKLWPKVHWEIARGSCDENVAYCSKQGAWEERGQRPNAEEARKRGGEATTEKWTRAKQLALSGRINEIDDELFIRYYNVFKNIAKDYATPPADLPTPDDESGYGVWIYGPTGTGKSYTARERYPGAYMKISNNKWWDGYQGQEAVIMDDLDKKHDYMCYNLKIWADRYAFIPESKGSSMMIRPKVIVVTSNYHPSEIWDSNSDLEPILRRFKIEKLEDRQRVPAPAAPGFTFPPQWSPVHVSQTLDLDQLIDT